MPGEISRLTMPQFTALFCREPSLGDKRRVAKRIKEKRTLERAREIIWSKRVPVVTLR
jgi:hypothetical protein